jgi:iron uptake system component EfeO
MSFRTVLLAPLALVALTGAACSSTSDDGGGIGAALDDFSIELDASSAPAGTVSFAITNDGPSVHEFEVLRTDTPADQLPVDSDVVQTSADGLEIVDEVEEIAPGTDAQLSVDLDAGSHVIICHVAGHYDAGMFTSFDAT